jgi:hypothetical protein
MRRALLVVVAAALAACSSGLRTVPREPPPDSLARIFAEYPPPPAPIEVVPPDPGGDCAWLDGHWNWDSRRWAWSSGAWVVPPPGCHITLALTTWGKDRTGQPQLAYAKPTWFPDKALGRDGKPATCAKPVVCKNGEAESNLPGEPTE